MLALKPVIKDYIWGGQKLKTLFGRDNGDGKISESWELSVHPDGESRTDEGTLSSYISEHPESVGGNGKLPILIKYIDAAQSLSVQVHPNDVYALANEGDNGKTELWYIISAEEGGGIYCGFRRDTDRAEFLTKVQNGTVEELLNFIPVKAGDCYLIEAGTVHAIGAGCVICEIQQSSNVTYRVYDYNRLGADGKPRPLHIERASEVINYRRFEDRTHQGEAVQVSGGWMQTLTSCRYFTCRKLELDGEYRETARQSFLAVNILSGAGAINGQAFTAGDSFFIPCGEALTVSGNAVAILTTQSDLRYYAGIDLGGTFIKCGIADSRGRLLSKGSTPTKKQYSHIAADMANLALRLAEEAGVTLSGIGIGAPGTVDGEAGMIRYSNNLGWKNVSLAEDIGAMTALPISMTNDANAAALGESAFGAGRNYKNMIFVTLGTGVGGGIVIDGKLYEGLGGAGAELGHMVIDPNGEMCTCGRRGCLEAYASTAALLRQAKEHMSAQTGTLLSALCKGDAERLDGKLFFEALKKQDPVAQTVFSDYLDRLSCGLINFANIFRPDAIILGGGISTEGELLTAPLAERMNRELFGGSTYAPVKLLCSRLSNDAGIYGAATLAMQKDRSGSYRHFC